MPDTFTILLTIGAMALITWLLRALPFMAGHWLRHHPWVSKLGDALPLAIMVLLVLSTATDLAAGHPDFWWREGLALAAVALLQWRLRQPLLSIAIGTGLYMLLGTA